MNTLNPTPLLVRLRSLHDAMRDHLHVHLCTSAIEDMSAATSLQGGDTIYALDVHSEQVLLQHCEAWGRETPFLLVAEGLLEGRQLFGCNCSEDAQFILICDPIDGTRPLMYNKRSAWMLTGIAPNRGDATNLSHIEIAMQTELVTSRALYSDTLWAVRGGGAFGATHNLLTGDKCEWAPQPSRAQSIEGGFAMFSKFFPGSKGWLANLEEELLLRVLGAPSDGQPQTFDDQYISTGGQLYELIMGHDRFNADLRPFAHEHLHGGHSTRLCCHPYDMCTELIARESGICLTNERGQELQAPLDVESPVMWIGYANKAIQQQIEPALLQLLRES
jgi:hypothetical protein